MRWSCLWLLVLICLFQVTLLVVSIFTPIFIIRISFVSLQFSYFTLPFRWRGDGMRCCRSWRVMECGGAAEATGLSFVLLLPTLLCCQPTDFGLFFFIHFPIYSSKACFCFCVFVIWLLSSFSVGCSCLLLLVFLFLLEFQIIRFVRSTFTPIFIGISFVYPSPPPPRAFVPVARRHQMATAISHCMVAAANCLQVGRGWG